MLVCKDQEVVGYKQMKELIFKIAEVGEEFGMQESQRVAQQANKNAKGLKWGSKNGDQLGDYERRSKN